MSQKIKSSSNKSDVTYLRATGPPAGPPLPVSPPPMRDGNRSPISQMSSMDDWDDRDEIRMRELEEARARATQMEKTMRWWSDCTANWREKWSKVRNERNKSREENRHLRAKLEVLVKECSHLKRERQEVTNENSELKKKLGLSVDSCVLDTTDNKKTEQNSQPQLLSPSQTKPEQGEVTLSESKIQNDLNNLNINVSETNNEQSMSKVNEKASRSKVDEMSSDSESSVPGLAEEKKVLIEMKLDEAHKTLLAERDEKSMLMKSLEKVQLDLNALKSKYDEQKRSKQDLLMEINKIKDDHKEELSRLSMEIEEESSNKGLTEKHVAELRRELEKLQRENADEWGKRERLETDKYALERENKKIRIQMDDMKEQLDRKSQQSSLMADSDVRTIQTEVAEKNKELNDLRHVHNKVKKTLQEKLTELEHSKRRSDQYEVEVKKLRSRVEELKKDLANAEDEIDTQTNEVRKQHRTNDELQEQMENLQVQLDHTQSRLRRSSQSAMSKRAASLKSFDPSDPEDDLDSDELPDDECGDAP